MRFVYTQEMLDFLQEKYRELPIRDIEPLFNERFSMEKTRRQLEAAISNHGITCGRKTRIHKITLFTPEQIAFIRKQYRLHDSGTLLQMVNEQFGLNKNIRQLKAFLKNHGITSGRTGCFKKGRTPWNAGKTGYMGANRGGFKRGNQPHNTKYLYYERIGKDGFVEISVAETDPQTGYERRFKHKHRWLWEKHNGTVPAGHVVIFKDGDRKNITLENLELVSRAELLFANIHGYKSAPNEVKPSILALARVEVAGGFRTVGTRGKR